MRFFFFHESSSTSLVLTHLIHTHRYKFNPAAQRQMNNMLDAFQRVRDKLQEYSGTSENKPLGLSSNMTRVSPSKTVALNDRCNKLVRGGKDIVNLSVGEPHFQPPSSVLKSLHSAIDEMKLDYTSVRGTVAFREAIAEYTTKSLGHQGVTADHVLTTTGAKFAIWLTMAVLLEPGSEVIVIKPYWTSYPEIVKINGGVPVFVDSDKDTGEVNFFYMSHTHTYIHITHKQTHSFPWITFSML